MHWRRFFRRTKQDREQLAELDSYLQIATDENVARGMPLEAARQAARKKLGNSTLIREEVYQMNAIRILDEFGRGLRHTARALRHNRVFTAVVVLTLALGIGANTAIFSVVNGVLIKPLPFPKVEALVGVWHTAPGLIGGGGNLNCSPSMYFSYREESKTFQEFGVWTTGGTTVTGLGEPEQVRTLWVTYGTLQALGVQPLLGRWFSPEDDKPGGTEPNPVILTYGYWQRRFGGDSNVIGRSLTVDSQLRQVAGVMPRDFRFLNSDPELISTLRFERSRLNLGNFSFQGIARLKPGVTIAQANTDLERVLPIWMRSWPGLTGGLKVVENFRIKPALQPLKDEVVGTAGSMLWVLMGTLGMVLLIACANVANLMLVRAEGRQQELAVRAALGAGWRRIAGEMLFESLLLGVLGGLAGLGLAYAAVRLLVAFGPANLPRLSEISIDPAVLGFALAASVFSGLVFGSIPALKYAGPRIGLALRGGGRNSSQSRERHRVRNGLVVTQVALALVLLVSSGLMIRTAQALRRVLPGFTHAETLQTVRISIPQSQVPEPERVVRAENAILDKLAAIPGVTSAAFSSAVPMDGRNSWDPVFAEGTVYAPGETPPIRAYRYISPDFFRTEGTRLIAGRELTWTDTYDRRPVAIVSENLARELWGGPATALGKRIRPPGSPGQPWREIVGVVEDVRYNGAAQEAPTVVYWPVLHEGFYGNPLNAIRTIAFSIRSERSGTEGLLKEVRAAVWSVNPSLPVFLISTMQELYDRSLASTSFTLVMLTIAGVMALALGIVGIYGVVSYMVSQRTREIGIRLALGAQQAELKRMFVRQGLALAAIGVAGGLVAAAGLTRLMSSLLFGIGPLDPVTYAAVPLVLVAATMLASYLPARRAAAVDPVEALRAE